MLDEPSWVLPQIGEGNLREAAEAAAGLPSPGRTDTAHALNWLTAPCPGKWRYYYGDSGSELRRSEHIKHYLGCRQ
jgi:hypothetical protein